MRAMKGQGASTPPKRPPLDTLRARMEQTRDGFLRETFVLPRDEARTKAREWFERFPKQAYWTTVESWAEKPDDVIEFTIRRLPAAD